MSYPARKALDQWLTLSLLDGPIRREDVPIEYTRALAQLAERRNFPVRFEFIGNEAQIEAEAPLGRNVPGCIGGSKRKVRRTAPAPLPGERVEPWNMRDWPE